MTFTYDLTDEVGQLRLKIGDTVASSGPRPGAGTASNFTDEELQHFIDSASSVGAASATAFEVLAAEWSIFTNITIGPRKEEFARIAEAFAKRAEAARQQYGGSGTSFSVGWVREDGYSEAAETSSGL